MFVCSRRKSLVGALALCTEVRPRLSLCGKKVDIMYSEYIHACILPTLEWFKFGRLVDEKPNSDKQHTHTSFFSTVRTFTCFFCCSASLVRKRFFFFASFFVLYFVPLLFLNAR